MVSEKSEEILSMCHPALQAIVRWASEFVSLEVREGHRPGVRQRELFLQGKTKINYPPGGKHCRVPSEAADIYATPIPRDLNDPRWIRQLYYMAGMLRGLAESQNVKIRWGGDWDRDGNTRDQTFNDLVHFEVLLSECDPK